MADADETPIGDVASAATPPPTPAAEPVADDFDKDRAMETIRKLRAYEKETKAKLARLAEIESAEETRKSAELSELEKTKRAYDKLQAEHAATAAQLTRARIKDAALGAAAGAALTFAPGALDDALALGLFNDLTIGDDGSVEGIAKHITYLHKTKPYLFAAAAAAEIGDIGATKKSAGPVKDVSSFAQRWGIKTG